MRYLLLVAAAAAIPLPEHEADAFVIATFEGVAVAVPRFADLGASQSYAAFLASLGIGGVGLRRAEVGEAGHGDGDALEGRAHEGVGLVLG